MQQENNHGAFASHQIGTNQLDSQRHYGKIITGRSPATAVRMTVSHQLGGFRGVLEDETGAADRGTIYIFFRSMLIFFNIEIC